MKKNKDIKSNEQDSSLESMEKRMESEGGGSKLDPSLTSEESGDTSSKLDASLSSEEVKDKIENKTIFKRILTCMCSFFYKKK